MVSFEEWERSSAERFREDPVWRMQVYRRACYAIERAWPDAEALAARRTTRKIASQLYYAVGSVGGNVVEGYSRSTGRDRARFLRVCTRVGSRGTSLVSFRRCRTACRALIGRNRNAQQDHLSATKNDPRRTIPAERRSAATIRFQPAPSRNSHFSSGHSSLLDQHAPRFLQQLLQPHQKQHRLLPVDYPVVVGKRQIHHRPDLDLSIDRHRAILDLVKA